MQFKEIIIKKDMLKIKFKDKKIPLVYRIREYQKLQNQSIDYVNSLKKNKVQIKYFKYRDNDKIEGSYYKLYSDKIISFKYRKKLVEMILNKKYKDNLSLEEYIYKKYEMPNWNNNNINVESIMLDVLGSYLNVGNEKDYKQENINKHEVASLHLFDIDDNNDEDDIGNNKNRMYIKDSLTTDNNYVLFVNKNKWEISHLDKEHYQKWIKKHKAQHKRWKQTSTYKFGVLFTYDNHKDKINEWDWINKKYVDYSDLHIRINRLIDPEKPYVFKSCYVDTNNEFIYKNKKYRISDEVKEYQKRNVRERDYKLEYPLDHIVVIEQNDKLYFFNTLGNKINNNLILETLTYH